MRAKTVDEYIRNAPKETQSKLKELRQIIKTTAPKAEEKISYSMPYYGYKGRFLYFAVFKKHIGFYILPPIVEMFKDDLKGYVTTVGGIQLPLDKKLPIPLLKKLIKARIKWMDEKAQK